MVRNVILLISTTAVLVLLFVGYVSLVGNPGPDDRVIEQPVDVSAPTQVADEQKVRIETSEGTLEIDPGGPTYYVEYDDLGRPIGRYSWQSWEKVPGPKNELVATAPEMIRRLPTGMIMTIRAERGQFSVDRLDRTNIRPKLGWLSGNAKIIFDRETSDQRTPLDERPEDRITISMDRMDFDLELGELNTAGPLRVESSEFEITGTGLHLIWNQDDNRVEKLLIESGGKMVLRGDLLGSLDRPLEPERGGETAPVVTQPAPPAASAPRKKSRKPTAYQCLVSENVSVVRFVGDERRGALSADELSLLFDIAGRSGRLTRRGKATTSTPATQPGDSPEKRVVVQWTGRLLIHPAGAPPAPEQPRRRFEASGEPVIVELPNGRVVCGRLALHEESKRLWLYPTGRGYVEASFGQDLAVRAASIFVDLEADTIKLVGEVVFQSGVGRSADNDALTISANLWAELHLAADREHDVAEGLFDNPLGSRPPESAVFVGDVAVRYQDQLLRANRLEADFGPAGESAGAGEGARALRAMLDSAVATGDVHLSIADRDGGDDWRRVLERGVQSLRRARARSRSGNADEGFLPPAAGEDRSLRCASLRLNFVTTDGRIHIRDVEASGAVEIYDRDSNFAARGRRLNATLTSDEDLQRATVTGSESNPAVVQARAYDLRGKEIEADNLARTLHIDGPSKLKFASRRSLQGFTRARADEAITVSSTRSLHVDERGNTVEFVGEVVAGTENEQLRADTLSLLLEDVSAEAMPPTPENTPAALRELLGNLLGRPKSGQSSRSLFADSGSADDTRKELARVVARNAVIQSETYTPDGTHLLEHQSISAPELQIDVRRRMIRTIGETQLLMTDCRLAEVESTSALNIASALMTRGPSQTAMVCHQGLVYVLGEDGPQRKDSVLLEGGVALRHVAGREIIDIEQLLPDVVKDPELLKNLENRNARLDCDRLEVLFAAGDATLTPALLGRSRDSMQLSWFNALGNVSLRDQQDDNIREVYAHQLEYDGANAIIRVLGLPEEGIDARVFDANPKTGRFNMPAAGPEIIINLKAKTIEARDLRGRAGT